MKKLLIAIACLVSLSSFTSAAIVDDAITWMYNNGLTVHNNTTDFKADN